MINFKNVSNRFSNRVRVERKALKIVNSRFFSNPLVSLSPENISRWSKINGAIEVQTLLTEIAKFANVSSGCSTEVFDNTFSESLITLEMLFEQLHRAIDSNATHR